MLIHLKYLSGVSVQVQKNNIMEEIWKDIPDTNGLYQVSSIGRIRSYNHKEGRQPNPKIMKTSCDTKGYPLYKICQNGKGMTKKIHRLVAKVFIDDTKPHLMVNHKDGNKKNNKVDNLEWVSSRENKTHGMRMKQKSSTYPGVSFDKSRSKWNASLFFNSKHMYVGRFNAELDAYIAVVNKSKVLGIENKYLI